MVEKENQKSSLLKIGFFLSLLVVIIAFFLIAFLDKGVFGGGNAIAEKCYDKNVSYINQIQRTEYYTETVPYSEEKCEDKEYSYNFGAINTYFNGCTQEEERCTNYVLGICTDKITYCVEKKIGCKITINNVDNEKGYWSFDFNVYSSGGLSSRSFIGLVETNMRGATIYSQSSQEFQILSTFTGEMNAGNNYYCKVENLNAPKKQVCETITKYKDVQREKIIAVPVTEYKIEKVCY